MKRTVEARDTDSGIQITISSADPQEIAKIRNEKQWYTETIRDHDYDSEHGKHHRAHHEAGGHHSGNHE